MKKISTHTCSHRLSRHLAVSRSCSNVNNKIVCLLFKKECLKQSSKFNAEPNAWKFYGMCSCRLSDYISTKVFSESESVITTTLANSLFKGNGELLTKSTIWQHVSCIIYAGNGLKVLLLQVH